MTPRAATDSLDDLPAEALTQTIVDNGDGTATVTWTIRCRPDSSGAPIILINGRDR